MLRIFFITFVILISFNFVYGQNSDVVNITISSDMHKVSFDGKWSNFTEWKKSSLDTMTFAESNFFHLRSAHQDNFIYFLIDYVTDTEIDVGKDKAMICLDTKNDKTQTLNSDDYCFLTILEKNASVVLVGSESNLVEISHPDGFIAISSRSDHNDRYSAIPHSTYEFRIPTELVGRNNIYGMYIAVYDESSGNTYTWPHSAITESPFEKLNPSLWGELISPDKSLPEFHFTILIMMSSMVTIIYLAARFRKMSNERQTICVK